MTSSKQQKPKVPVACRHSLPLWTLALSISPVKISNTRSPRTPRTYFHLTHHFCSFLCSAMKMFVHGDDLHTWWISSQSEAERKISELGRYQNSKLDIKIIALFFFLICVWIYSCIIYTGDNSDCLLTESFHSNLIYWSQWFFFINDYLLI